MSQIALGQFGKMSKIAPGQFGGMLFLIQMLNVLKLLFVSTTLDTHYKIIQFLNMFPELNHESLNSRNSLYQRPGQKAIGPTF